MRFAALVCNVVFWVFFCMVVVTDGPPKGIDVLLSLAPLLMPILNVVVIRGLSSRGSRMRVAALVCNVAWLGLACWLIADRYPSHPKEAGLIAYVALAALTPLLSAATILLSLRVSSRPRPR